MTGWNAISSLRYGQYRGIIHNWSRGPVITLEWINYANPLVLPRRLWLEIRMIAPRTQQRYKISVTKSLRNLFFHGVKKRLRFFLFISPTRNYRVRRLSAIDSDIRCLHRDQIDNLSRSEPVDIREKEGERKKSENIAPWGLLTWNMTS